VKFRSEGMGFRDGLGFQEWRRGGLKNVDLCPAAHLHGSVTMTQSSQNAAMATIESGMASSILTMKIVTRQWM
jgi:hypothetical protein